MKKLIGVVAIIVAILVVIIVKRNDIYKVYKTNQIKKDFVNILNGNFNERTNEFTKNEFIRIHKSLEELNHNNITDLISAYINSVLNGMDIYIKNNKTVIRDGGNYIEINKANDVEYGKDIWMKYLTVDYAVGESFTNEDVRNYSNGNLKDLLINNLKECLDYEEQDGKIEWYINSTEDKIIELPYNCYIDYKAYNYVLDKSFRKVISVVDKSKFNLDKLGNIITVKYIMNDGKEKTKKIDVSKWDDGKYRVSLSILGKYINCLAECTLSSHTLDVWRAEMEAEFFREYPIVD